MSRHLHLQLGGLLSLALLVGCPDESVTHTRVAKESREPPTMPMPVATAPAPKPESTVEHAGSPEAPPGMKGDVPAPPKPQGGEALTWTLPAGWTQTLTSGIRYATLEPAGGRGHRRVGGRAARTRRRRGRQRQPLARRRSASRAIDDAGARRRAQGDDQSKAGAVSLYDFTGEGDSKIRLVAGLVVVDGNSWFFKMVGRRRRGRPARLFPASPRCSARSTQNACN